MSGIVRMQQDQLLLSKTMRKFIYIVFAAALFATSCEQEQTVVDNGKWPIHYGYMQFSTNVSTRAQLVTDMKGKSFGVLGYQYSPTTNWATAKPVTAPMPDFYNLEVSCASNNGNCAYDAFPTDDSKDLKEWEESNYSFFAYYPKGGAGITLSTATATNTPTLTYTYGWLNPPSDPNSWYRANFKSVDKDGNELFFNAINLCHSDVPVFDLMTAEAIDVNGRGDGRVGLDFKHRMFALEVLANNYNENEYKVDENGDYILDANGNKVIADPYYKRDENGQLVLDDKGDPIWVETDARKTITNLVLTLNGLRHRTMTIPLSMQGDEADPVYGGAAPGTRSFLISDPNSGTITIPAFNETTEDGRGEGVATSISLLGGNDGNAGYLMLIPQSGGLSGSLNWNELYKFPGTVSTDFSSGIEFKAGKLYQLYINFVGDGITIALIEAGAWDVHDVEHKFE